jgi:hypothetical protein
MPVEVVDYDPAWQHEFAEQRDRLKILLRGWLCEPVEHVGSTRCGRRKQIRNEYRDRVHRHRTYNPNMHIAILVEPQLQVRPT